MFRTYDDGVYKRVPVSEIFSGDVIRLDGGNIFGGLAKSLIVEYRFVNVFRFKGFPNNIKLSNLIFYKKLPHDSSFSDVNRSTEEIKPVPEVVEEVQADPRKKWPKWFQRLMNVYYKKVSGFFIVDGNINDQVSEELEMSIIDFLEKSLELRGDDFFLRYDLESGFTFTDEDKKSAFKELFYQSEEVDEDDLASSFNLNNNELPIEPVNVFEDLKRIFSQKEHKIKLIVEYSELIEVKPKLAISLRKLAANKKYRENGHLIILLPESIHDLDSKLRKKIPGIRTLHIKRPEDYQRVSFLRKYFIKNPLADFTLEEGDYISLMSASRGLSLKELESILDEGDFLSSGQITNAIFKAKKDLIKRISEGTVEFSIPKFGFDDLAGIDIIIKGLLEISQDMKNAQYFSVPQSILFVGPPGTGKTAVAKAMAKSLGVNFFVLGSIFNKYVGETERRIKKALQLIKEMGGILFIDEVDQDSSRGDADSSGTAKRVFKEIMTFLGDDNLRGKVLVIMATNRPDLMDAAMLRPGRSSLIFSFFEPSRDALVKIFQVIAKRENLKFSTDVDLVKIVDNLLKNSCTGAHANEIVSKAFRYARRDSSLEIKHEHLEKAVSNFIFSEIGSKDKAKMRYYAFQSLNTLDYLLGHDFIDSSEFLEGLSKEGEVYKSCVHYLDIYEKSFKELSGFMANEDLIEPSVIIRLKEIKEKIEKNGKEVSSFEESGVRTVEL